MEWESESDDRAAVLAKTVPLSPLHELYGHSYQTGFVRAQINMHTGGQSILCAGAQYSGQWHCSVVQQQPELYCEDNFIIIGQWNQS